MNACVCAFVIWATILYDPVLLNIYNIQNFTLMKMIMCISKFVSVPQNQYYYKKKYNIWIIITITQQCVTEATLQEQIILYDFLMLILNTGG
jgi:hypothetical protein